MDPSGAVWFLEVYEDEKRVCRVGNALSSGQLCNPAYFRGAWLGLQNRI